MRKINTLFQLVYVSSATVLSTSEQLCELLQGSHRRNAQAGVTGLLLYKGGNFM